MQKTRLYMSGGWTVVESSSEGLSFYWLVSPVGTWVRSFPTKERARLYWLDNKRNLMRENVDNGRKLAESNGLVWDELSEHEQRMWTKMSGDIEKEET